MPAPSAITTASTEAQTDAAPLTPHNHGASAGASASARLMPIGNGIPMKNPRGRSVAIDTRTRTAVEEA
jgi:hypothetical protein